MVDSKCSTEDSYIEVNKGDNVNGDGNDEHSIDAFDEEGGGVAIAPYSKTPAANRKYFVAVVCTFFIGFLAGALAMWFGGSKLGLCSKNIASESRVEVEDEPYYLMQNGIIDEDYDQEHSTPKYTMSRCEKNVAILSVAKEEVKEQSKEVGQDGEHRKILQIVNNFTVVEQVSHDPSSFTQGLSYGNGKLYETTGLYGQSKVRRIDPDTFNVELSVNIESKYFGEGSTYYTDADGNGRLIEITWKRQTGWIYDAETLTQLKEFTYTTTSPEHEGWGITYDASKEEFIVSDGTQYLYVWDRDTLAEKRKIAVTRFNGRSQNNLNELEYMDGLICCNIWYRDEIICVDPMTGNSVREYDMSSLWPKNGRNTGADVLNGIALANDHVLITGKKWSKMFKVVFPDWPTLFASAEEDGLVLDSGAGHNEVAPDSGEEQPVNDANSDSSEKEDVNAVSYNFLRTAKGSQTLHSLLKELLKPTCISDDNIFLSGPRRALNHLSELMESDGQILSSCHPLAHNLGRAAYQYFGSLDEALDGMVGTDDAHLLRICNAAYLHGVIEYQLRSVKNLNKLASAARKIERKVCKNLDNVNIGGWECRHGIGHGIMQRHRMDAETYAIRKALATCNTTSVPEDCENGLWMDHFAVSGNIMAMESGMMATDVVVKEMKAASSYFDESQQGEEVSAIIDERFKLPPVPSTLQICALGSGNIFACFISAPTEYLLAHQGDYIGALHYCTDPSAGINPLETNICIEGVGAQCAKENLDDFSILEEVCQTLDEDEIAPGLICFGAGLNYYMNSFGSGKTPNEAGLCDNLTHYKETCQSFPHEP